MLQVFATQPGLTESKFQEKFGQVEVFFFPASGLAANKLKKNKTPLEQQIHDVQTAAV